MNGDYELFDLYGEPLTYEEVHEAAKLVGNTISTTESLLEQGPVPFPCIPT